MHYFSRSEGCLFVLFLRICPLNFPLSADIINTTINLSFSFSYLSFRRAPVLSGQQYRGIPLSAVRTDNSCTVCLSSFRHRSVSLCWAIIGASLCPLYGLTIHMQKRRAETARLFYIIPERCFYAPRHASTGLPPDEGPFQWRFYPSEHLWLCAQMPTHAPGQYSLPTQR